MLDIITEEVEENSFKKYCSIENSYQEKTVDFISQLNIKEWSITEKIHGCFKSNTPITLADGSTKFIKELVDTKYDGYVMGVDRGGNLVPSKVLNWFNNGYTDEWLDVLIQNRSNTRKIKVTPNHRVYSNGSYVPIRELNVGDSVEVISKEFEPSFVQKEIIKGLMLGDGSYQRCAVVYGHKKEHEEYVSFIEDCLSNVNGNRQKSHISGYGTKIIVSRTISCYHIQKEYSDWKNGNISRVQLTPISLAFWYMGDGSLSHHESQEDRASIAVCGISDEGCLLLVDSLADIGLKVNYFKDIKGYNRFRFNAEEADKLYLLIAPYVPVCMQYKLPERYRTGIEPYHYKRSGEFKPTKYEGKITKITKVKEVHGKYDLETETHNYFANGTHVHNSNACLSYFSGDSDVKFAKRTDYVQEDESFYNIKEVFSKMGDATENIKKICKTHGYKSIEVFGELFGGHYPHKDVPPVKNAQKVQKGVYYIPDNNFLAFDIRVDGAYVDVLKFQALCIEIGTPFIPIEYFKGNVYEALEYCNSIKDSQSEIHKLFCLPQLEDNEREGVVLKPSVVSYLANGNRVILKIKNDKFLEKSHAPKVVREAKEVPENVQESFNKLSEYATENRIDNCISHLGEVTIKDFGKVMGELLPDIYTDFEKDGNSLNILEKNDRKQVNKMLTDLVCPMIRVNLLKRS